MRIAIDARELTGHPTGVGRYLSEILKAWRGMPDALEHEIILCAPEPVPPPAAPLLGRAEVLPGRGLWWEQVALPRWLRRTRADVLFAPGYSGPVWGAAPLVVTVHDVSFAAHPEWFRWREGLRRRVTTRLAAARAVRVLTVSEFSRREIHEHLGVPLDRILAVPSGTTSLGTAAPGAAAPGATRTAEAAAVRQPHVLYVGSLFNRRHLPALIAGFGRLARRHPAVRLTVIGEDRTFPHIDIEQLRATSGAADRIDLHPRVTDEELGAAYGAASAFAFLSEYEGFGLTPLDALAREVPVVLLDTPVAREVFGESAEYVPRPDPALVDAALERVLFDDAMRRVRLAAARPVLERCSWRRSAATVLHALVEAAASRAERP
ncbi:MAG: glycosyltransferase family 4 protein [Acidimicrobiia bacterium]|nr:glycosyltransferase family 4 protein [Acidimicrobiia bacterium]